MGRYRGYWWAPDGIQLLAARVDNSRVLRWWIADPASPQNPPRAIRYPAAGTASADVSLHVLCLDGTRTQVAWDRSAFEYLAARTGTPMARCCQCRAAISEPSASWPPMGAPNGRDTLDRRASKSARLSRPG